MPKKSTIKVWFGKRDGSEKLRIMAKYQAGLLGHAVREVEGAVLAKKKFTDYGYSLAAITLEDTRHEDCSTACMKPSEVDRPTCFRFSLYIPEGYRDEFIFMCCTVLRMYANGTPIEECKIEIEVPIVA